MTNDPFGRQPLPVKVTITGKDKRDVEYWYNQLIRRAEFKGDLAQPTSSYNGPDAKTGFAEFMIYPRAVND